MPKLLALDMSGAIGWMLLQPGRAPLFDTKRLKPEAVGEYGGRATELRNWLLDMIMVHQPDAIAAEAPLIPNKFSGLDTTTDTVLFLSGIVFVVEQVCSEKGIRFLRVHNDDAKIALLGTARNVKKITMIAAAHDDGVMVATDHEADAYGVGLHAYEILYPARAA